MKFFEDRLDALEKEITRIKYLLWYAVVALTAGGAKELLPMVSALIG